MYYQSVYHCYRGHLNQKAANKRAFSTIYFFHYCDNFCVVHFKLDFAGVQNEVIYVVKYYIYILCLFQFSFKQNWFGSKKVHCLIKRKMLARDFVCNYLLVLNYVALYCLYFLSNSPPVAQPQNKLMRQQLDGWRPYVPCINLLPTDSMDIPLTCYPSEVMSSRSRGQSLTLEHSASLRACKY